MSTTTGQTGEVIQSSLAHVKKRRGKEEKSTTKCLLLITEWAGALSYKSFVGDRTDYPRT